jgi:hypothetical protein
MDQLATLIGQIMATAPHQLPPIIHTGGTYVLDVQYAGFKVHHIGITIEESLWRYLHFINGANAQIQQNKSLRPGAPVPQGSRIKR